MHIASNDELLDEQSGHDRLAGPRIVGQQEAQRLARQHVAVDRCDLVRQRLDEGRMHGQHGIEEMREVDAIRFGREAEQVAISLKAPGTACLHDFQGRFIISTLED
jgi:hypothetical protein